MTALTAPEQILLRAGNHKASLFLSIHKPATVFTALVAGAHALGARAIVYDGDMGEADVLPGMTLWVGSLDTLKDVGVARVRSINTTTNTITTSENSLVWGDDQFLRIKREWALWPIYPRFTAAGEFFKDYDVAYTDENTYLKPVATMGPPRAAFDDGSKTVFNFLNSGSYGMGGATIASRTFAATGPGSYAWATVGGDRVLTITGAQRLTDATWVSLTVTDSNGKTQVTYRPVFCYDRTGTYAPISDFRLDSLSGDWERGGWSARITAYAGCTTEDIPDGTLILLWHEATYGSTAQFIGGEYTHAKNILFAGYVRGETITQDWNTGTVSFEATTIDGLLRRSMMFSVPLRQIEGTQDRWYELAGPTVAEAVHHYWRWHSTLFEMTDVFLPTSNTLRAEIIEDFARGDLYSEVDNFTRQYGIFAHVCCNKIGQVHVAEDAQMLDTAPRAALTTVSTLTTADRREALTIIEQPQPRAGLVHVSGFGYPRTPLIAKAPGDAPLDFGAGVVQIERQILQNQGQANIIAGRVLATMNNPYPEVRAAFAGHYLGALDVVPQEWWTLSLNAGDTPRGLVWTNKRLIARNVTASYDPAAGSILADAVFETEAEGEDGIPGDYPITPPTDPPAPPPPVVPPAPPSVSGRLVTFDNTLGHYNQNVSGAWEERNDGVTLEIDTFGAFDPWWPVTQGSTDIEDAILWRCQVGAIYRSTDCGRNWIAVTGMGDPSNDWADSPAPTFAASEVVMLSDNIYRSGERYFLVRWANGAGDWRGWVLKSEGDGAGAWTWQPMTTAIAGELVTNGTFDTDIDGWLPTDGCSWSASTALQMERRALSATYTVQTITVIEAGDYVITATFYRNAGYASTTELLIDDVARLSWGTLDEGVKSTTVTLTADDHTIKIYCAYQTPQVYYGWWDNISVPYGVATYEPGYPIWMDTDTADGAYLYVTVWEIDGFYVKKIATSDLSIVATASLGACTIEEVLDGTYVAYPRVQEFSPSIVYVYGKMPGGIHLEVSNDAGGSFSEYTDLIPDGDHTAGAFLVGHDGTLWAIENTGGVPVLWKRSGSDWVEQSALLLTSDVPPDGLTIIPSSGTIALASATNVVRSNDAGASWADQAYPASGDIRSLLFIA